jgi:RNA polymerase sigma-70 factor (ECF subfamily)
VSVRIAPGSSKSSVELDAASREPVGFANDIRDIELNGEARPTSKEMRARRAQDAEVDRALIERAQRGDKVAFRQLVERYERRAVMLALAIVHDENDARELAQEAFLRVYKHLDHFNRDSTFFTWLYRIITNLGIDFLRRPSHRRTASDVDLDNADQDEDLDTPFVSRMEGANPVDVVRRREIASRIQHALELLPSYHRAAIIMREIDGLSYDEMAEAAGVSKGTIMSRLFHARQKLQRALADCYSEQVGARTSVRANEPDAPGADE